MNKLAGRLMQTGFALTALSLVCLLILLTGIMAGFWLTAPFPWQIFAVATIGMVFVVLGLLVQIFADVRAGKF